VVDKLLQVLVFGCGYRKIADATCSATTIRDRRDQWIALGVFDRLELLVLQAYDRRLGLALRVFTEKRPEPAAASPMRLVSHDRQCAVAGQGLGPRAQARAAQHRRQARLAELGFAGIDGYLWDRSVGRGWSVRRLCAELGAGHGWLDQQLAWLGLRL
jgi:hypothetical protein